MNKINLFQEKEILNRTQKNALPRKQNKKLSQNKKKFSKYYTIREGFGLLERIMNCYF